MRSFFIRKIWSKTKSLGFVSCTVCFGDPNSPMVAGLNAGIMVLLTILIVLLSFFGFLFLRIRKRSKLSH